MGDAIVMNSMKDFTRDPHICKRSPFLMSAIQSKWSQPRAALNLNGAHLAHRYVISKH
jgi:hypothetical protein